MNNIKTETERRSRHAEEATPTITPMPVTSGPDGSRTRTAPVTRGRRRTPLGGLLRECGDTDGPAQLQSPEVQALRALQGEHRAKHAATRTSS